jgi:HPt (histidine-containing phosphotransfer) domain-containing protein
MPREKIYAVEDFPEEETAPVATYEANASYPPEVSPHDSGAAPEEEHQPHPGSGEDASFGEAAGTGEAGGAASEAPPAQEAAPSADEANYQIDVPTAMKYCGGMEAMQVKFLSMFVSRRESVVAQLLKDLEEDNIPDYTTHIHAVKSTSLSVGGLKLSETAKALEMAGHAYQDGNEEEKEMNLSYIKEYNGYAIELYEKLAQEAKERFGVEEG